MPSFESQEEAKGYFKTLGLWLVERGGTCWVLRKSASMLRISSLREHGDGHVGQHRNHKQSSARLKSHSPLRAKPSSVHSFHLRPRKAGVEFERETVSAKRVLKSAVKKVLQTPGVNALAREVLGFSSKAFNKLGAMSSRAQRISAMSRHLELPETNDENFACVLRYYDQLTSVVASLPHQPKISVLVPLYKVEPRYFEETLQSIGIQLYPNWEVCVVDDRSGMGELADIVHRFEKDHPGKVKFAVNEQNSHISLTSNACLSLASGDYIALLDHDDRLYPNALAEMVRFINLHDCPDVLYSDERNIEADGALRHEVYFKPDWSPFMHLCMNYTTHLSVYRTSILREIGGFRKGFEGSQDHDLMLRVVETTKKPVVHVPLCLYQWRAHPLSTAHSVSAKPYAAIAGEKAVAEHLARRGRPAKVEWEKETAHYRLTFSLPEPHPLVSILIPARDKAHLTRACVESISRKTTYSNYEVVLVDNSSTEPETFALYEAFAKKLGGRFRLLSDNGPFNFARLNNHAVAAAKGDYVVLLNNDTEVLTPQWIEEMLMVGQFPEVGAVGAQLLYPNGAIQHGGVLLTDRLIAQHAGIGLPKHVPLYCNQLKTLHEVSAVTAACLFISKKKFEEVGGLDERWVPNGYGDIDLCLRLRAKGYSHLYTPYAELVHHESPSRRVSIETFERQYMIAKYGHSLMNDPYLNPNLRRNPYYDFDPDSMRFEIEGHRFAQLLKTPRAQWNSLVR